ncbi:esterase-like activity of phytase family protein [Halarcobacter sp.]|uniref:esterase-like activity of phytase family protein n=1 Tax=Halarcobacter sp. TaxID=2321133 RepID=UPI002AAC21BF|nr:esterase-like activity of phytase family protein [Halarcobacter sp.]
MNKQISFITSLSIATILGGCTSSKLNIDEVSSKILTKGSQLPYSVLRDDLIDANTGKNFEIRNGGYGSDMVEHPTKSNQFYALTDRGPNATFKGKFGKGKKFPTPNYTPRIGLFELQKDGSVILIKQILLKRPDGSLITGLPNTSAFGGTGETPYDANGEVIRLDMQRAYDKVTNPIRLDDFGLDGEGLVALEDGTFWISDEYGPHIVHFNQNGKEIERINAFTNDKRVKYNLPQEFENRRANRGMEGLTITPDESTLVGIMQSTMYNPSKKVKDLDLTRIVTINPSTGKTAQYLYKQDKNQNSNSGIASIGDNKYYVIERDGSFAQGGPKKANPKAQKYIYEIDLSSATNLEDIKSSGVFKQDEKLGLLINGKTLEEFVKENGWDKLAILGIKPVSKKLVLDMVKAVNYPHDKMEGMWIIDKNYIGILNDDDFATWSTKGNLHSKMLGNGKVDSNTLYIQKIK